MLLTTRARKQYIDRISRLIYASLSNSSLLNIPFKPIMVLPQILLQSEKPIKKPRKKHVLVKSINNQNSTTGTSKVTGEINGARKLLTSNNHNGMLPLNEETVSNIQPKNHKAHEADTDVLLTDEIIVIHPIK